jgi:P4 family phage/plasmid primase-like protien
MARPKLTVLPGGGLTPEQKRRRKQIKDDLRKTLLNAAEVTAMLRRYGCKEADGLPLNTLGHARRMFNLAKGNVMAMTSVKNQRAQWIVFVPEFGYWTTESATLVAEGYVVAVGDQLRTWAEQLQRRLETSKSLTDDQKIELPELIDKLHSEANKLQGSGRASVLSMAMVRKPEAFMDHHVSDTLFDADPDHLVVKNGVIDLQTGKLMKHDAKFKLTRHIDVNYDPSALKRDSVFLKLVTRMFPDPGVLPFVHKLFGYLTTGYTSEQAMVILLGLTGTGKSTLLDAVAGTLGQTHKGGYTTPATAGLLRVRDAHWGDTATIEHARLLIDAETGEDTILDAARIKRLTGEQSITTNAKYGKHRTITITGKIVLMTNHPPVFAGAHGDDAVYRRLFIVPCNVQMYEEGWKEGSYLELPKLLKSESEREVILAWLVAGAKKWYAEPLRVNVPAAVEEQLKLVKAKSGGVDEIQMALTKAGYEITYNPDDIVAAKELIAAMKVEGPAISATAIGRWLSNSAVQKKHKRDGDIYIGIQKM